MTATLFKCFDAAFPPASAPPGANAVLGYVGRPGFTPHVWTPDEWRRFSHLRQFPAWLPDFTQDPRTDAQAAVDAVEKLGWAKMKEPDTRLILLDGEAATFMPWYTPWADQVINLGFYPADYGSLSTVLGNAAYDVWAADWDGIPELVPGQTTHAKQYAAGINWQGTQIDLSVLDASTLARGGVGPRHG